MQYTENYSLKLPGYGDNADVGDLNDNTTAIDALIHANRQIEAPAFSTDTAYTTGDMCVYENVLYKFTADKAAGNWDSTKVTATNLADEVTDAAQSGGTTVIANPSAPATEDLNKLQVENTVYGIPDPTVTKTATGNPIEITDATDAPLVKCTTTIQGYQEGTGTPSPDNVRPIHAYTQSTISGVGKNKANVTGTDTTNGYVSGYYLLADGSTSGSGSYAGFVTEYIPVDASTDYYLSGIVGASPSLCLYDANKNYIAGIQYTNRTNFGFTTTSATKYVRLSIANDKVNTAMLEKGTSATTYEPYKGYDSTATFSNSIYQGNADFVGGTVRSTWGSYTFTGSEAWTQQSGVAKYYSNEYLVATTAKLPTTNTNAVQLDTPIGIFTEPYTGLESKTYSMCISRDGRIGITADIYADISMLTGMTVWFELATPTTETITPTNLPLKSLFGYNHIESSTGDMEIEYITQTYQPIVDLIDSSKHVYSTAEQVVGKWIDGSDVYEKTIVTEFNNAVPQYTLDLSAIGGDTTMPIYVSHSVLEAMEGSTPIKQITMPAATNSTYSSVSVQHQSSAVTGKSYIKVRYIKLTSNNRSLSKGSTDWLKADLSEEKKEIEELPETEEKTVKEAQSEGKEVTEKVEEPIEEKKEEVKEENAGESNSENER